MRIHLTPLLATVSATAGGRLALAAEQAPLQSALSPRAAPAELIANLSWWMIGIYGLVFVVVMALGLFALYRGRNGERRLTHSASRRLVLLGGVLLPLLILTGFSVASMLVGQASSQPYPDAALTVEVVGKRWWWQIRYYDRDQHLLAVTANELQVPAGQPVKLLLRSSDVIHSFWAPNLDGKTDMIPGLTNTAWLNIPQPGVYRGQCAEFCGTQHSLMAFKVAALAPDEFQRWLDHQSQPAVAAALSHDQGRRVFAASGCADCHSIRGTQADGGEAPDLTHLASRQTLAAGTLPNTRGHLAGWISDPQSNKPGALMPATPLQPQELQALLDYLQALK
nr:cytochrome c oxidase subunit II [uncultured Pseudomonas sp.]